MKILRCDFCGNEFEYNYTPGEYLVADERDHSNMTVSTYGRFSKDCCLKCLVKLLNTLQKKREALVEAREGKPDGR